ncbi:MAG: AraC family transcriptional regulator, partial [Parasporobacterium sp.]|nr:AraC family transcriptional regulator [Parasporobacterium sp.]
VGFGNYSYFTEQFKKYYGMTPRDYQKREKK